jgi:tankyrase
VSDARRQRRVDLVILEEEEEQEPDEEAIRDQFNACKNGDLQRVKSLVNELNVNSRDRNGRRSTCLHFAAGFGRVDICEHLLAECHADPSIKDEGYIDLS